MFFILSRPRSNDNEEVHQTPQITRTGDSSSFLGEVSYPSAGNTMGLFSGPTDSVFGWMGIGFSLGELLVQHVIFFRTLISQDLQILQTTV